MILCNLLAEKEKKRHSEQTMLNKNLLLDSLDRPRPIWAENIENEADDGYKLDSQETAVDKKHLELSFRHNNTRP